MRTKITINCKYCSKNFLTPKKGSFTSQFCSQSCASKFNNSKIEVKEKIRKSVSKPKVNKICEWCNIKYSIPSRGKHSKTRRFCSCSCAAKWRMLPVERRETSKKYGYIMSQKNISKKRPDASTRMKENNPMYNIENINKMKKSMQGKTFLSRGGNPKKTLPQIKLAEALNLTEFMEYQINTFDVKDKFQSLPHWYKVDIAIPDKKIAIEVDGNTHKSKKWKQIDKRKTKVLESLGWTVIRFWNDDILNNLNDVLQNIAELLEKKSKVINAVIDGKELTDLNIFVDLIKKFMS